MTRCHRPDFPGPSPVRFATALYAVFETVPRLLLVLFTDGLVESRVQDIDDGPDMLADALSACGGHDDLEVVAEIDRSAVTGVCSLACHQSSLIRRRRCSMFSLPSRTPCGSTSCARWLASPSAYATCRPISA